VAGSPNVSPDRIYRRLDCTAVRQQSLTRSTFLSSIESFDGSRWALLKLVLRFEWVKVVHDGSLPSRYSGFSLLRKLLFRLSVSLVDEFAVVNEGINEFLRNGIGVRQNVRTVNALLPIPDSELSAGLSSEIEPVLAQYDRRVVSTGVFIPSYGFGPRG